MGLAHVGTDGRFLRVNTRLCDMLGYTHQELMERAFQDITHPDDLAADLKQVRQMLDGELSTYSMEKRYFHKSGEIVWANLTVSLVRRPEGTPDYFISVIEDITRRHRAELERDALLAREHQARTEAEELVRRRSAELEAARSALVQAERLATAGQLAAGVGHEINNPLSYVLANVTFALEELAERELDESLKEVEDALQQARKGAERIRGIVKDLRTFASSKFDALEAVDVRAAVEFAVAMAEHQLRLRAQIVRDYAPVPSVVGNESRLGQVFLNLLLNATQALPEGAVLSNRVTLTIRPACGDVGGHRGARHGVWNPRGEPRPHLRALLHHEARGRGVGAGALGVPWHRHQHGRPAPGGERAGPGEHVPRPAAGGGEGGGRARTRGAPAGGGPDSRRPGACW